jgi:hypothetical protein
MLKLDRKLKIAFFSVALVLLIAGVVWYPYKAGVVPAWKLHIIDSEGRSVTGAQVVEQWNDPIDDGVTREDSSNTDSMGSLCCQSIPCTTV